MGPGDTSGGTSTGSYDKTKVLDVKPLRCLAPVFPPQSSVPSHQSSTPNLFVPVPPFGPVPSGYVPFYPFYNGLNTPTPFQQKSPQIPVEQVGRNPLPQSPVANSNTGPSKRDVPQASEESEETQSGNRGNSYSTPSPLNQMSTVGEGTSNGMKKSGLNKRVRVRKGYEVKVKASPEGDSESVAETRMKFDALRRRISQIEETTPSAGKRPDLKAGNILMNKGIRTNMRKRTGSVPGIEVGDIFFFRMEICLVGLHAPSMAGIDYMNVRFEQEEEPIAVSIVSSGGYDDIDEDKDVLIYSGQGGNISRKDGKDVADQKLERGNLALERSLRRGNEVRVIRGMRDLVSPTSKVYIYDGLYKIHESWTEKGKSGCNVFKYKLLRVPGQPEAFGVWKAVQQWRDNINTRPGLILPDLTSGAEKLPVALINDIDDEKGPAHFTYSPTLKYSKPIASLKPSVGCNCFGQCLPVDPNCSCGMKNGGNLPHTVNGVLVIRRHLIYECGPSCKCYPNCKNQVSQNGLKVRLEVFKTNNRGWGLRSWDAIRAGTFICEYAGEVIDTSNVEEHRDEDGEDDYFFDSTCDIDDSYEWNYLPELLDEDRRANTNEAGKLSLSLTINAKNTGNVARFMNHSCSPNVFWQPVLYDHSDESCPHIMFYAMKHIPPMTELTYDYGVGCRNIRRRKSCLCGSLKCKGFFH